MSNILNLTLNNIPAKIITVMIMGVISIGLYAATELQQ